MSFISERPSLEEVQKALIVLDAKKRRCRRLGRALIAVAVIAAVLAGLWMTVATPVTVQGYDMQPAVEPGSLALVDRLRKSYAPGEIVYWPQGEKLLRVAAVGGDIVSVSADDGKITVNGRPVEETGVIFGVGTMDIPGEITVPENAYFLIGDNRVEAVDSRVGSVGCVSGDEIMGRAWLVLWPRWKSLK